MKLRSLLQSLAAVLLCAFISVPAFAKYLPFEGTDLSRARLTPVLNLSDTQGTMRALSDFEGKALLVFFGYTQCPDVCPTTLAHAAYVMELLGDQTENVQVLMISVDPERDTPEVLDAYASAFHPDFIGLRGDAEALEATADSFNAIYVKEAGPDEDNYTINHTAALYLLDPEGKARVLLNPDMSAEDMVHDIQLILEEGQKKSTLAQ